MNKFRIGKRISKKNPLTISQLRCNRGSNRRIWVNGKNRGDIGEFFSKRKNRGTDLFERSSEIFAAMRSDKKNSSRELR